MQENTNAVVAVSGQSSQQTRKVEWENMPNSLKLLMEGYLARDVVFPGSFVPSTAAVWSSLGRLTDFKSVTMKTVGAVATLCAIPVATALTPFTLFADGVRAAQLPSNSQGNSKEQQEEIYRKYTGVRK